MEMEGERGMEAKLEEEVAHNPTLLFIV